MSLGKFVFLVGEHISPGISGFLGRGTHITKGMFSR